MDKLYSHCKFCKKKFKGKDEVVSSIAGGGRVYLHNDCHFDYLLNTSDMPSYFDSYEDMIAELTEDGILD